ncbi:PHD and RING finger domain-containing protein 1, partial [Stegodyphus mimosarum]
MSDVKSQTEMSKHSGVCPICYDDLRNKCIASPDVCEHIFCLDCLQKSSKLGSFCPVDRKRYRKIINVNSGKSFQIKPRRRKRQQVLYDVSVYCEICSKSSEGEKLLLCDCCDLGYHCKCLSPPLKNIPSGQWFCPECLAVEEKMKKSKGITKETECSGTGASYSNFQEKEQPIKKRIQDNTSECRYERKESTVTKKLQDNSTENRYMLEAT